MGFRAVLLQIREPLKYWRDQEECGISNHVFSKVQRGRVDLIIVPGARSVSSPLYNKTCKQLYNYVVSTSVIGALRRTQSINFARTWKNMDGLLREIGGLSNVGWVNMIFVYRQKVPFSFMVLLFREKKQNLYFFPHLWFLFFRWHKGSWNIMEGGIW